MTSAQVDSTSTRRLFLALLVLLLVVRGACVLALADVFQYGEELEKGTAAKALLDGVDIPYPQKAYHLYEGGGFVISHLKAAAFLVVGENVLAHKLAALFTTSLVLAAGFALTLRHFGRTAALAFGLLLVFGPASYQKLSLLSLGIHYEAMALALFVLDRAMRLAFERRERSAERLDVALLGAASGFGVYFNYQLVLFVAVAFVLLVRRRRDLVLGRVALLGLAAFALGIAPLAATAAAVGGAVFDIHGTEVAGGFDNLARIGRFLGATVQGRGGLEIARAWLWPAVTVAVAGLALGGALPERRERFGVLVAAMLLWLAAYALSGFVADSIPGHYVFMRLAPLYLLALVLVAAGLGLALERGGSSKRLATVALAVLFAAGTFGTTAILAQGNGAGPLRNLAFLWRLRGYDYAGWAAKVYPRLEGDDAERIALLLGFDEDDPSLLRADLASAVFPLTGLGLAEARDLVREIDPEHADLYALGMGRLIATAVHNDIRRALQATSALAPEEAARLGEACGRTGVDWAVLPEEVAGRVEGILGLPGAEAYMKGVGYRLFRTWVMAPYGGPTMLLKPAGALAWIDARPAAAVPHLRRGFAAAARQYGLELEP